MAEPAESSKVVRFVPAPKEDGIPQQSTSNPVAPISVGSTDLDPGVLNAVKALDIVLAQHNVAFQRNIEQATSELREQIDEFRTQNEAMKGLAHELRNERDQFKNTAERMIAQATEVQQGLKQANAVVVRDPNSAETDPLASVLLDGRELAYPIFSAEVADRICISKGMVKRLALACGIWENPDYHANIQASKKTISPRYKERAIDVMRRFLEDPESFGVDQTHKDWDLIRHHFRMKRRKEKEAAATRK